MATKSFQKARSIEISSEIPPKQYYVIHIVIEFERISLQIILLKLNKTHWIFSIQLDDTTFV